MSRYIVTGGHPLKGEVSIRGAKNASFKEIIASMLTSQTVALYNLPSISDVHITESIAESLGSKINQIGEHSIEITTAKIRSSTVPSGTGEKSRTSFMFAAPLLAKTGEALIPLPGGDKLGTRPLDRLFDCYRQMNITIEEKETSLKFTTTGIIGTDYTFPKPSHTVTEVIIMTAVLAKGVTTIRNAALEPEIDDLIILLNNMGAKINRLETDPSIIIIQGVDSLHGTQHQVVSDRNETITFACAALTTRGSINILRIQPQIIDTFLNTIVQMGAKVDRGQDEVTISWIKPLMAIKIETSPQPGFMTDWQPIFSVVLTQAVGCSTIVERIFPNRFQHIPNLIKMGAKATFFNPNPSNPANYYEFNPDSDRPEYFHGVKIYGPAKLKPTDFKIADLRAGACATLAALTASGQSIIDGVEYIERGYEKLAGRLCSMGATIDYIKTPTR